MLATKGLAQLLNSLPLAKQAAATGPDQWIIGTPIQFQPDQVIQPGERHQKIDRRIDAIVGAKHDEQYRPV
ncbi:MAG TPA: hypothetical protein DCX65_02250 [Spirochaetaceae bacterium]|nr:hypothetical protein [Spirochaetaceae bacterium]